MTLKTVLTNVIIIIAILVLIVLYFMIVPTMQGSFDADPCDQEGQICSVDQPTGAYVEHPSSFCEVEEEKCWVEVGN
ncbi:hypothetical protein H8D36_00140 [archaeon]|nr:hypothetical protein [archaeon]MBL7057478.1 hypothetical protein [Candidatus Woesearchaeota archaeon]